MRSPSCRCSAPMPFFSSSFARAPTWASSSTSCAATASRSHHWSRVDDTELTHALVADDEPHIGRIIKMKLEQGPFRVSLAYDGQEALDFINGEDQVDLAL